MVLVSIKLPKSYRSETMIQVNPQKVPENYVKSTVSTDITDRLQTISQEILSRTRLQKVIDQFGLYRDHPDGMSQEDIIEMMRKDITVNVDQDSNRQRAASFKIAYVGKDPALVQQVTRQIASLFIEENLKVRQDQAMGTSAFIEGELQKAHEDLTAQEDRIKAFKARNMGSLPEQQQANLAVLGQMQALLQANSDAIGRAQQQKSYLESVMEAMGNKQAPISKNSSFQGELNARRAELVAAEEKYTPDHPDVKRLRNEVKALEAKAASLASSEPQTATNEPGNIKAQLTALQQELVDRNKRQSEIESRIRSVQGRIEMLPNVEQQFAEINRDYLTSQANYQSLLEKKNSSAMSAELETHAKGEQFRVLDPASFPEKPFKPNLILLDFGGLIGGLALGCGLGMLMEVRDPSLHNEKDLGFLLSAKVLGTIPVILTPISYADEKRKARWELVAASVCAMSLLVALAVLYRHNPTLFKGLIG
jgi:polysaccharide chain length determinant protein (PEP-CTERM system associated)